MSLLLVFRFVAVIAIYYAEWTEANEINTKMLEKMRNNGDLQKWKGVRHDSNHSHPMTSNGRTLLSIYDSWQQATTPLFDTPVYGAAIGYANDKIYFYGNLYDYGTPGAHTKLLSYTPGAASFTREKDLTIDVYSWSQASTQIDNILYIADYRPQYDNPTINRLNLLTLQFESPLSIQGAGYACITSMPGYLFILGGSDTSAKIYDISSNKFANLPAMSMPRFRSSCVVHIPSETLYIFGGSGINSKSVEMLFVGNGMQDIMNQNWMVLNGLLTSTSTQRLYSGAVAVGDYVMCIGGETAGSGDLIAAVNVVDTRTNTISEVDSLVTGVKAPQVIIVDGTLYVFGGAESRDPTFRAWQSLDVSDETNINECEPNPCLNGGVCTDLVGKGSFECDCTGTGYYGLLCEVNIDDCSVNECQNGGVCIDEIGGFSCDCDGTGFTGSLCELGVVVDCVWSAWSVWSKCRIGGKGVCRKWRTRTITTPAQNGGAECVGKSRQSQKCEENACGTSYAMAEDLSNINDLYDGGHDYNTLVNYKMIFFVSGITTIFVTSLFAACFYCFWFSGRDNNKKLSFESKNSIL